MGASSSKKRSKKNFGSHDDGCIGNRKVRTICLSVILIAFCAVSMSYLLDQAEWWKEWDRSLIGFQTCETCTKTSNAYYAVVAGSWTIMAFAGSAILLFFVNCGDSLGRVTGAGLIIGGMLYLGGWIAFLSIYNSLIKENVVWQHLSDEDKNRLNARLASIFGEAMLPSASAILLGIDVFMQMFDNEANRLFTNLGNLCAVSVLTCPVYYILSQEGQTFAGLAYGWIAKLLPPNSDGYPYIASGYAVIFWVTLLYMVLYLCTCCTCNCKDNKVVRLLLSIGLMVGGILTSVGYYIFAAELTSNNSDSPTNVTLFYIGYTVLVAGSAIVWGLDIGLDDMRNL